MFFCKNVTSSQELILFILFSLSHGKENFTTYFENELVRKDWLTYKSIKRNYLQIYILFTKTNYCTGRNQIK